jgi:hypothetical protein
MLRPIKLCQVTFFVEKHQSIFIAGSFKLRSIHILVITEFDEPFCFLLNKTENKKKKKNEHERFTFCPGKGNSAQLHVIISVQAVHFFRARNNNAIFLLSLLFHQVKNRRDAKLQKNVRRVNDAHNCNKPSSANLRPLHDFCPPCWFLWKEDSLHSISWCFSGRKRRKLHLEQLLQTRKALHFARDACHSPPTLAQQSAFLLERATPNKSRLASRMSPH